MKYAFITILVLFNVAISQAAVLNCKAKFEIVKTDRSGILRTFREMDLTAQNASDACLQATAENYRAEDNYGSQMKTLVELNCRDINSASITESILKNCE